ncbi:Uncharacterised protein [Klebsiella pneumoniae]|nr:Uncharacterised protein [Klebsiella pneumoniae]
MNGSRQLIIMYSGMAITSSGSIMVDKITRLTSATPRNFLRASA